jgi:hypothetical protein
MLPASLKEAIGSYIELLASKLRPKVMVDFRAGPTVVHRPEDLRDLVGEAEGGPEFSQLVIETEKAFPQDGLRLFGLRDPVKNFFRRTGYYYRLYFDGKSMGLIEVVDAFANAFGSKWLVRKRYLAPLTTVQFGAESIKFRGFEIRNFSSGDLDQLLGNSVNEVFYPWAKLDLSKLAPYWFIDVYDQSMTSVDPEVYEGSIDARPSVRKEFTEFPKAIETALRPLALYDWEPVHKWASFQSTSDPASELGFGWFHFRIPFWLEVNENLLVAPPSATIIPDVEMEIVGGEDGPEFEIPFCAVEMDVDNEATFGTFVSWAEERLTRLDPLQEKWPFVEIAIGFLLKGFFSEGLEQLLWHITVLESLFGENKEGNTSLIADRLGRALEGDRTKRDIKRAFRALYNFRSEMVHGKEGLLEQPIYVGHLREGRQLARSALLWFVRYLEHVQSHAGENLDMFPEREELLAVLDFDGSGRERINQLIGLLPDGFPSSLAR